MRRERKRERERERERGKKIERVRRERWMDSVNEIKERVRERERE